MRVLVLDHNLNPTDWGARDLRRSLAAAGATHLLTRRPPAGDLPPLDILDATLAAKIDAVVMSGSLQSCLEMPPWARELDRFLGRVIGLKIPVLGVCYGHQALARVLGGPTAVGKSETPEYGPTKMTLNEPGRLLAGLPKTFYSNSSHREEVRPEFVSRSLATANGRVRILAHSDACAVQAFEVINAPIFGVQFHPEKSADDFARIKGKRVRGAEHFDAEVGETIFRNFLNCAQP